MERASFAKMPCPIARAVEEVGEGWTLLILREAYKGAVTFTDFQERLPIAPNTLTRRLEALTERGFFEPKTYQTHPPRQYYELTEKALDLLPVLLALGSWGNRWLAPEGELVTVLDPASEAPMDLAVIDRKTSREIRAGAVAMRAGPGAKRARGQMSKPVLLGVAGGTRKA